MRSLTLAGPSALVDLCRSRLDHGRSSSMFSNSASGRHRDAVPQCSHSPPSTVAVGCGTGSDSTDCQLGPDSSHDDDQNPPVPCARGPLVRVLSSHAAGGQTHVAQSGSSSPSNASRVVAEIIDTERKYVRDLRHIIRVSHRLPRALFTARLSAGCHVKPKFHGSSFLVTSS